MSVCERENYLSGKQNIHTRYSSALSASRERKVGKINFTYFYSFLRVLSALLISSYHIEFESVSKSTLHDFSITLRHDNVECSPRLANRSTSHKSVRYFSIHTTARSANKYRILLHASNANCEAKRSRRKNNTKQKTQNNANKPNKSARSRSTSSEVCVGRYKACLYIHIIQLRRWRRTLTMLMFVRRDGVSKRANKQNKSTKIKKNIVDKWPSRREGSICSIHKTQLFLYYFCGSQRWPASEETPQAAKIRQNWHIQAEQALDEAQPIEPKESVEKETNSTARERFNSTQASSSL